MDHIHNYTHRRRKRQRLRYSCESCRHRRVKCDGNLPCSACVRGNRACIFDHDLSNSQIATRDVKVKLANALALQSCCCGDGSALSSQLSKPSVPRELQFNAQTFGSKEMSFIHAYQEIFHSFSPIVCSSMIREGINPVTFESLGLESSQTDIAKQYAAKAATWAAAVLGASLESDGAALDMYEQAIGFLRECYDYPCEEVIRAYCVISLAACQLGDDTRFLRYRESAKILFDELSEVSDECRVCLFYCTVCVPSRPEFEVPFDVEMAERLPFRLQVLYVISFASYKIDVLMSTPSEDLEQRASECFQALNYLHPMAARLRESPQSYNNVIGQFFCYSLTAYYAVNISDEYQCLGCLNSAIELLSKYPQQLLILSNVWNIAKTMVGFLLALGKTDKAAIVQSYLMQYPCFAPLGEKKLFKCDFLLEDFKLMYQVKQGMIGEDRSSRDLTSDADESHEDVEHLSVDLPELTLSADESGSESQPYEPDSLSEDELRYLMELVSQD